VESVQSKLDEQEKEVDFPKAMVEVRDRI